MRRIRTHKEEKHMSSNTRKDEVMTSLVDGIKQLTTSETWQQWLKTQSRFHRYSFNNSLLIQFAMSNGHQNRWLPCLAPARSKRP